jgi:hypothetical protein
MQVTLRLGPSHGIALTPPIEFVVFVPPRTQGVIVDPNFPIGHPTATRLAQPWGPPQWPDGTHSYPIPGPPPPAYYAPYYHPGMPPLTLANAQVHPNTPGHPYAPPSNSPDNETCVHSDGDVEVTSPDSQEREASRLDEPRPHEPSVPVIDPSLESSEAYVSGKSPVSLAITSAAVQAVFDETRRIERQQVKSGVAAPESREPSPNTTVKNAASVSPEPSTGGNPPSTMLTEDGETMLHPGELTLVRICMGYLHRC